MDLKLIQDNIEERLDDHLDVVSYRWLSQEFGLHINKAKLILENFYENRNDVYKPVFYIECLSKDSNDNEISNIQLVTKEHLEVEKAKGNSQLCYHLYSLQKIIPSTSNPLLSWVSKSDVSQSLDQSLHAVHCSAVKMRLASHQATVTRDDAQKENNVPVILKKPDSSTSEIIKATTAAPSVISSKSNKLVNSFFDSTTTKQIKVEKSTKDGGKSEKSQCVSTAVPAKISQPKKSAKSFFGSQQDDKAIENKNQAHDETRMSTHSTSKNSYLKNESTKVSSKSTTPTTKKSQPLKPTTSFFVSQQATKHPDDKQQLDKEKISESSEEEDPIAKTNNKNIKAADTVKTVSKRKPDCRQESSSTKRRRLVIESDSDDELLEPVKNKKEVMVQDTPTQSAKKGSTSKKRDTTSKVQTKQASKVPAQPVLDSESDSDDVSADRQDFVDDEQQEEEPKKTGRVKVVQPEGQKNKRRRQVVKTFLDEDGFMVTEKVWETVTDDEAADDDENETKIISVKTSPSVKPLTKLPRATSPVKKPAAKKKLPQKGKKGTQMALTSFFKQK